ncbi:hypothetical protein [Leptodesmis sichuanensis]|uniref:hypothetical protein n=1 Tax=Leptodesmis sichuanensis TaxID=2906798 RepID=UPI001F16E373|nr:hypothetical protein [Leptodesmis sichuanensis]UIE39643.1 hypothetical protein KIK02_08840 [Leptodesmis sichuanensis A121]
MTVVRCPPFDPFDRPNARTNGRTAPDFPPEPERTQRILEIQSWIEEPDQTLEKQARMC